MNADFVTVLNQGKIEEQGTHSEALDERRTLYSSIRTAIRSSQGFGGESQGWLKSNFRTKTKNY
jgi:ABC-type glutathione transport system ATPase component